MRARKCKCATFPSKLTITDAHISTENMHTLPACPVCGSTKKGKATCCGTGGSWQGKCGNPGNKKFEHTWTEGIQVCTQSAQPAGPKPGEFTLCIS